MVRIMKKDGNRFEGIGERIDVRLTLLEEALGMTPGDPEIYGNWIASKAPEPEVGEEEVVVMDTVLAEAIHGLSKGDQAIVLLYYFAEWTDRRIAEELGCPRSTVQFRRSKALLALRARLEEVIGDDEL